MITSTRVRFAPSPTGFFHIGGARTALFNWLYARHTGGTFVLRIEDTDAERDTPEFLDVILKGLRWLGLDWDEGPEKGGEYGPYFQSQRAEIYRKYLEKLRLSGRTYEQDGAVFFKISGEPQTIHDVIRGDVVRQEEKDFVIVRSNGQPVFHFVNVVDDIAMRISHVIRGEDHLSNTSKHVELFRAFAVEPPIFAHIPLILKSQGSGKMSKRDTGALVEEYEARHFLPEAVRNYLCLLGWSPKEDRELLPIEEVIRLFDLNGINKNNARFDEKKMHYFNTSYLHALAPEIFCEKGLSILRQADWWESSIEDDYAADVLHISQEKLRSFEELPHFVSYFFREELVFEPNEAKKYLREPNFFERIGEFKSAAAAVGLWAES
ncbi:MAG: glutamate--tRNA ligase, partial [Puniceicoccales bacterium]|nr:glutamate--tRNA ligase [Puniceicoccales bacterium]